MKISNTFSGLVLFIPGLLQHASASGGKLMGGNLDDLCPGGSTAENLPTSSPWKTRDGHPSCTGSFTDYPPKYCSGDESSVIIYLDGHNTHSKCMAATTRCNIQMRQFQQLDLDVRLRDCEKVWTSPLWQMPIWQGSGGYNQGYSGEYDIIENCGWDESRTTKNLQTNRGSGQWRAPKAKPQDDNFHDKTWSGKGSEFNTKSFDYHVTVQKQPNGHLSVQYCKYGATACTITSDSADYGMSIYETEFFTGTNGGHPPNQQEGVIEYTTDIWNVNNGSCESVAQENSHCRYSLTNVQVKGGLENGQCSQIKAPSGPTPSPTPGPTPSPTPSPTPDPRYAGNCEWWCKADQEQGTNSISAHCGAGHMWGDCGGCAYCPNCLDWCKGDQEQGTNSISKHCHDPSMVHMCSGCQYCFHDLSSARSEL